MTSQYSTKENTILKPLSTPAMRINPTSPYQPSAQQQLHQQQQQQQSTLSQRHHPQQQHHGTTINNALQQPASQVITHAANANSTASPMQGVFNNNGQQQIPWPNQKPVYSPLTKTMQPTPAPPINTTTSVGVPNNWPQHPQQATQQNVQNVNNMYQQNVAVTQQHEQWPQSSTPAATYDNYYQQQQQQPENNNMYPPQPQQHALQQNPLTYFQQQPPPAATQTNAINFFDQSANNNNQTANSEGWGDWDWNDNSATTVQPTPEQADVNAQLLQQPNYNNSLLADSFNMQNNNDSWSWESKENEQHVSNKEMPKLDNPPTTEAQKDHMLWNSQNTDKDKQPQNLSWPAVPSNENQQQTVSAPSLSEINAAAAKPLQMDSSPPPPPPLEFSSNSENHNYNTNATATSSPNNIPNTVFVTQAKPVTLPSRQYASPPSGNTPITDNPPEPALMPPQGFQNVEDSNSTTSAAVLPPPIAIATGANVLPPAGLPAASSKSGNPFKRSGVAQHHRATTFISSATGLESTVFNMPPPPPADFANPAAGLANPVMEPDNNELPSQENQEVLAPPTTQMSLPKASPQPPAAAAQSPPPPPPNDERNQYLQTSHLSENSEEQQPEIDGLLPPPGLSRLVLGEPELEASQQRLVMGTEAPNADNTVNQAAVMHLEERHADGEDTASENAVSVTISSGQGVTSTSSTMSSDRNLYMVPGESNSANNNQQRVVTGVELAEQREIEMDGENLEDEQFNQQQQHLTQTQHQHVHPSLLADARNEPPVEGADATVATAANATAINVTHPTDQPQVEPHHHSSNQLSKIKDSIPISSPNDDDESDERLLNDRGMNQSTAGSSKSRTKYGNERLSNVSRRRDKRSSVERYESDEYFNSEGEYSSEREERERRELDRRRNYREGSVRSERGANEDEDKRLRRQRAANKRDKYYYEGEARTRSSREDRDRVRGVERSNTERRSQRQRGYDNDSRYETEESTRFDSRKDPLRRSTRRHERDDQAADYDDYNRRAAHRSSKRAVDNYESDRREHRRSDKHREPRYREDARYDPREYEDYRKHSSRNARESDLEKDAGAMPSSRSGRMHHDPRHAAAMYGYPSGGYYDPYTAYYYQQMARTNPQAYAEWYKKFYGQASGNTSGIAQGSGAQAASNSLHADTSLPASANDGRESVHSGRSSVHNDIKDRSGAVSVRDQDPVALEPQRLTPCKFITEHTVVNFASGILVTVKPKYTASGNISNIVKLLKFKPNDETRKLFKVFPGPLVRGLTHKKTVIEFCQEQIRLGPLETTIYAKQLISNNAEKYRGSYSLMWNLLILLLKQNGMVVGTDIAELLLKNQQQFPYQTPSTTANNSLRSKSGSNSSTEDLNANKETEELSSTIANPEQGSLVEQSDKPQQEADELEDSSLSKSSTNPVTLSEEETTEKFRNYLLYGNVSEALEWATDNNLWGHALFLASKLDRRSHANVMMKFANKLSLNDPLQTLYQLMSGRTPSSVTCVQDEKWGDWRPHLSMILSNTSQKPELDRKAITSLGDSLFNRGDLYAAHFCYLMAQVGFGRYQESATHESSLQQHLPKLVLLGSSHYKHFKDFAHNEAIVMTEIYEYACSLNDDKFSLVEFQPYKFLLATRLLDYGFHLKSLMYLEQIAVHIARDVTKYESSFINKVYELADRLKYYDPVLEKTMDDQQAGSDDNSGQNLTAPQLEEQKWLQNLRQFAQQCKRDFNMTPAIATAAQDTQQAQLPETGYYNQQQQHIDQQFMEINKQFSELNFQYQTPEAMEQKHPQDAYQRQQPHEAAQPFTAEQLPNQSITDLQQPGETRGVEALPDYYPQQPQYLQPELTQPAGDFGANYYDPSQYKANNVVDNGLDNQEQANYDYWAQQQPEYNQTTEEPEQIAHKTEDNLSKQANKLSNANDNFMVVRHKTPLALHSKKSLPKHKANISHCPPANSSNNKLIAADTFEHCATSSTLKHNSTKCLTTANKSVDLNENPTEAATTTTLRKLPNNTENTGSLTAATPFSINNNARPTISMPKTKSYETEEENSAKHLQQQQHLGNEANNKQQQVPQTQQKGAKKDDTHKNQQHANQNSGWFGGIWHKFSLKPKNQMILPDDKNPSIVWDAEKKKWVNTDGDEDEQEALKPPPKMSDLMPQSQQSQQQQQPLIMPQQQLPVQANHIPFMDLQQQPQQSQQPQMPQFVPNSMPQSAPSPNPLQQQQNLNQNQPQAPGPAKTPTLQSNMFKMQRNRTLKNAYVDVFNPSGAPVNKTAENILAPALPPAAVPQSGFFIPGGSQPAAGQEQQYQQQPQQQDAPQFYNPNQFASGTGY